MAERHTAEGFSFFAAKARVERIGDSPFAPFFEVVEKPDGWSRSLPQTRRHVTSVKDANSDKLTAFWTRQLERPPDAATEGIKVQVGWSGYTKLAEGDVQVSIWIGQDTSGIYVRGTRSGRKHSAARLHADELTERLGRRFQRQ